MRKRREQSWGSSLSAQRFEKFERQRAREWASNVGCHYIRFKPADMRLIPSRGTWGYYRWVILSRSVRGTLVRNNCNTRRASRHPSRCVDGMNGLTRDRLKKAASCISTSKIRNLEFGWKCNAQSIRVFVWQLLPAFTTIRLVCLWDFPRSPSLSILSPVLELFYVAERDLLKHDRFFKLPDAHCKHVARDSKFDLMIPSEQNWALASGILVLRPPVLLEG